MAVKEMSPEARALRNAYMRENSRKNKERERNRQIDYWERKAKELKKKEMDDTLQRLEEAWEEPEVTNTFENLMLVLCRYGRDNGKFKTNFVEDAVRNQTESSGNNSRAFHTWLEAEPENKHDPDAIAVYCEGGSWLDTGSRYRYGYIAKEYTSMVKPILDIPHEVKFTNNLVLGETSNKKGVLLEIRY